MSDKLEVLLVGDHPYSYSGNGNMMRAILGMIDYDMYNVMCFGVAEQMPGEHLHILRSNPSYSLIYSQVTGTRDGTYDYGAHDLLNLLSVLDFNIVVFVGIDVWRYIYIMENIAAIRKQKNFVLCGIMPYDQWTLRQDWVRWFNIFDFPCVYSQYGFDMLEGHVKNLTYFRPPLANAELYVPPTEDDRKWVRSRILGGDDEGFIFGFVGKNQFRKDPAKVMKAFSFIKDQIPKAVLYMHTSADGVYNLNSLATDYGLQKGSVLFKRKEDLLSEKDMASIFGSIDCLVNASLQEGLSWTILQAMLCGTPVIGTKTTAQTELLNPAGMSVPCYESANVPLITDFGPAMIESFACNAQDLANTMLVVAENADLREDMKQKGLAKGKAWLNGVDNINMLLASAGDRYKRAATPIAKRQAVLFAQHSSAGDILMSTQCLKGIKERHKNLPLVYMTQPMYQDLLVNNPYIDEIIDWDERMMDKFAVKYNPHGEKILPGGWNNLDATLHSLYPYFCRVTAEDMFVDLKEPSPEVTDALKSEFPLCVVHTTGGNVDYRTYTHLDLALKKLPIHIVQIGADSDYIVRCAHVDLRGKLSWRETAWVMSQARCAVCVDSFPMHLAGALGIDVVGLFGPAPARVTQPRTFLGARAILLEPNKLEVCPIMSSCWGHPGRNPCMSPCINTIPPNKIKAAVMGLLGIGVK